jgi:hypothetical protein
MALFALKMEFLTRRTGRASVLLKRTKAYQKRLPMGGGRCAQPTHGWCCHQLWWQGDAVIGPGGTWPAVDRHLAPFAVVGSTAASWGGGPMWKMPPQLQVAPLRAWGGIDSEATSFAFSVIALTTLISRVACMRWSLCIACSVIFMLIALIHYLIQRIESNYYETGSDVRRCQRYSAVIWPPKL